MINIVISISGFTIIVISLFIWGHIINLKRQLDQLKSVVQSQNEYYISCTQFYIDCHHYSLLALRFYVAGIMNTAIEKENYELANSCKIIIAEMEKLVGISESRTKNNQ